MRYNFDNANCSSQILEFSDIYILGFLLFQMLEERIKLLSKELTFLKDIFMAHADSKHGITVDDMELQGLLKDP